MYIHTEYPWYTTPKYRYWFIAILGRKKQIPSETWTHPTTSIVNSDFWNFVYFAKLQTSDPSFATFAQS